MVLKVNSILNVQNLLDYIQMFGQYSSSKIGIDVPILNWSDRKE